MECSWSMFIHSRCCWVSMILRVCSFGGDNLKIFSWMRWLLMLRFLVIQGFWEGRVGVKGRCSGSS